MSDFCHRDVAAAPVEVRNLQGSIIQFRSLVSHTPLNSFLDVSESKGPRTGVDREPFMWISLPNVAYKFLAPVKSSFRTSGCEPL